MKHAVKLPLKFDLSLFREEWVRPHQKYTKVQRYARNMEGTSIPHTETMKLDNAYEFLIMLPHVLLALETPQVFLLELPATDVADPVLPAHVDINKTCGINVYLEAHGETTKFYKWNKKNKTSEFEEEFCAEEGDCWLMDTTVPHSVTMLPNTRRRILTFSFTKTKYEEVLGAL